MISTRTKLALTWIYLAAVSLFYGFFIELARNYHWHRGPLLLGFCFLCSFGAFLWYYIDASVRAFRRKSWLNLLIICIAIIGIPTYLFMSRGPKRGIIGTLIVVGLCILSLVIEWIGMFMAYGILLLIR